MAMGMGSSSGKEMYGKVFSKRISSLI